MDNMEIKNQVDAIQDKFGMSGKKAAEAMSISYAVFRQNKAGKDNHNFSQQHLDALKAFLKNAAAEL